MGLNVDSKSHYALTYRYLQVLAVELRAALHQQGVRDVGVQQKILETFLFGVAMSWDDGCIEDNGSRAGTWHPTPCFRDSKEMGESRTMIVPDGADAFHEMAVFGAVEDAFALDDPERDWKFTYDGVDGSKLLFSRLDEAQ
jgi:extradiol dioxygenase family protein